MTTTPQNQHPSSVEKRRLRRLVRQSAQSLLDGDQVEAGAEILAGYRQKYGSSGDHFLQYGLAMIFLTHLLDHCCVHQASRVAKLLTENIGDSGSWENSRSLVMHQMAMWRRFGDLEAEESCYVTWQAKNTSRHDQS